MARLFHGSPIYYYYIHYYAHILQVAVTCFIICLYHGIPISAWASSFFYANIWLGRYFGIRLVDYTNRGSCL